MSVSIYNSWTFHFLKLVAVRIFTLILVIFLLLLMLIIISIPIHLLPLNQL